MYHYYNTLSLSLSFPTIFPDLSFSGYRCSRTHVDDYLRLHVGCYMYLLFHDCGIREVL
jgi:hypothetical protein